jgi:hypothetical protein
MHFVNSKLFLIPTFRRKFFHPTLIISNYGDPKNFSKQENFGKSFFHKITFPTKLLFQKLDSDLAGLGTGATEKFSGKFRPNRISAHPRRG